MPPDPVLDQAVVDSLATVQSQLNTLQIQGAVTPTPAWSSSLYAVPVSSPTNVINLQVQHTATVGDLLASLALFLVILVMVLRIIFNGVRGLSL